MTYLHLVVLLTLTVNVLPIKASPTPSHAASSAPLSTAPDTLAGIKRADVSKAIDPKKYKFGLGGFDFGLNIGIFEGMAGKLLGGGKGGKPRSQAPPGGGMGGPGAGGGMGGPGAGGGMGGPPGGPPGAGPQGGPPPGGKSGFNFGLNIAVPIPSAPGPKSGGPNMGGPPGPRGGSPGNAAGPNMGGPPGPRGGPPSNAAGPNMGGPPRPGGGPPSNAARPNFGGPSRPQGGWQGRQPYGGWNPGYSQGYVYRQNPYNNYYPRYYK